MGPKDGKEEHLLHDGGPGDEQQASDAPAPEAQGAMQTIAGVMGNVLEWYDFALFGFFSDVIATVFFAPSSEDGKADDDGFGDMGGEIDTSNLVHSFAVYGGAFLMRPVGGLVIGFIGEGRVFLQSSCSCERR